MATIISSLPAFVSAEEHSHLTGSTPDSFALITPLLRHREPAVSITLRPPLDAWHDHQGTSGTLYVIERSLSHLHSYIHAHPSPSALVYMSQDGPGLHILYPSITLHAISRSGPVGYIYCQLSLNDDDQDNVRELSIFPQSPSSRTPPPSLF
jgi:nucleotide-sensitive chloride channel 1A